MTTPRFLLLLVTLLFARDAARAETTGKSAIRPERLRCEYLVDPLGIDVVKPRLSWIVTSSERGQRQTAYHVLVASSPELLAADQGDLWNTSKVDLDETIHIVYEGRPLLSRQRCYWKVRVWDRQGTASAWSKPAAWSMGLLQPEDWQAEWIAADVDFTAPKPREAHNGYHSDFAKTADTVKWVAVDLGDVRTIDAVRLHPARPFDYQYRPGFLFPVRFKIEVATKADFSDVVTVVDRTGDDVPNPGAEAMLLKFEPTRAKYVRLTANRLAERDPGSFGMALAEMEVLVGDQNTANGAKATSLDSIETVSWSLSRLVDGRTQPDPGDPGVQPEPASMLRKEFNLPGPVKRATVYATGLGLYDLSLNGRRVDDRLLAPEWTVYGKRIQYQTYDVTELLREGENSIGAVLCEGWYAGLLMARPPLPSPVFRLLLRLEIEMADGTQKTIVSDGSWQGTNDGPIRESSIYVGEVYDARKEMPGWDSPGFDTRDWKPALVVDGNVGRLVAQPNEPIRVTRAIQPVKVTEPTPGVHVYDMGQNMVGWCRVKLQGPRGTTVKFRHAELLNDDGTIWPNNLGTAKQTDYYTLRGDGRDVYEPHFTYHGFRYFEISGVPEAPPLEAVTGRVFHSAAPEVGSMAFSKPILNDIARLIIWVQRGNLHSTPTDCPQRGERFGWMGDIQAFGQTAIFNMDMAAFFTKWVPDIRDSQAADGRFADFSPSPFDSNKGWSGVPAWGDAGTIVPWRVYQNYADSRMLEEHFESARRWVDFVHQNNPNLLWQNKRGNDYNDWLNGDTLWLEGFPTGISAIPNEVFATAFFAQSAEIVATMAKVTGRTDEAAQYGKLARDIKKAFQKEYVDSEGRVRGDTQAGYAVALAFNMVDEAQRLALTKHLVEAIRRFNGHPSTGIQTTHRMMLELSRNGQHEEAYRLATLETVPSWGGMVKMGATTIWERWDGYVKGRGPHRSGMNSFNHWALGSVGEWMWRNLVGINPDDSRPGYKHVVIRPRPAGDLTWAKGRYDSIRGPIESDWKIADGTFTLRIVVPANTTATVYVPTRDAGQVRESGRPAESSPGVSRSEREEPGMVAFEVESGEFTFSTPW